MSGARRDGSPATASDAAPVRVLCVDDEPGMRDVTEGLLESASDRITVTTAGDAETGLDLLASEPFDCIVSDYQMPDVDGLQFLDRVRATHGDLPFVLFTGKGSEEIASEAIARGVTDYLQKGRDSDRFEILANRVENAADQYRARRALEHERAHRAALFEDTDPIVELRFEDDLPIVTGINSAFERVFGFDEASAHGRDIADLIVPESERALHRSIRDRVRAGETVEAEVQRTTTDGIRDFSLRVVPMSGTGNDAYAWYTDITDRKERERELQRQNERLEEFASVLGHDLRNPLMVARGSLELARETGAQEDFDRVDEAHERMESLVADILTLAVEGRAVENTVPVALARLVRDVWETLGDRGVTLDLDVRPTFRITADAGRLRRLLENLLSNAVAHGPGSSRAGAGTRDASGTAPVGSRNAGRALTTVRVGILDGGSGFYVEDDGAGLPTADHETVFEWGYTTTPDGTGFGLAIVHSIVEAHGWTITAGESPDGGARFEVQTESATC